MKRTNLIKQKLSRISGSFIFSKGARMEEETKITTQEAKKLVERINKILDKDGYITKAEFNRIVEDSKWNIYYEAL